MLPPNNNLILYKNPVAHIKDEHTGSPLRGDKATSLYPGRVRNDCHERVAPDPFLSEMAALVPTASGEETCVSVLQSIGKNISTVNGPN